MSVAESQALLIARHLLDGATPGDLARQHDLSIKAIETIRGQVDQRLRSAIGNATGCDPDTVDLNAHRTPVLRLLLDWREAALWNERAAASADASSRSGGKAPGPEDPPAAAAAPGPHESE